MAASGDLLEPASPLGAEPGTVILESQRLILRRYNLSDAPALAKAGDYPAVAYNMRSKFPSPYTLADAESFLANVCRPGATCYPLHIGIFIKPQTPDNPSPDALFIGATGVVPMSDVYFRTWELGYWITPSVWGKGYMTEAVKAFTQWLFQTWPGLNRIEASTYARNVDSGKVLKRCAFVEEGRKRSRVDKKGEIMDEVIFGLLRSDVEKV